jgi:alternate F1F0 ATPase F1 subunit gamma
MSDTTASLRHKIKSAGDLQSVVRTMKPLAASSIVQYEQSVRALGDYARTAELGLSVCFRGIGHADAPAGEAKGADAGVIGAVVFGSDQGLVGQFNDLVAEHAVKTLEGLTDRLGDQSRRQLRVWAVGERVQARLADAGLALVGNFTVLSSAAAIPALVGEILVATEAHQRQGEFSALYLFYKRPGSAAVYAPVDQRLLPLDEPWRRSLADQQPARGHRGRNRSRYRDPAGAPPRASVRLALSGLRRIPGQRERQPTRRNATRRQEHRRLAGDAKRVLPPTAPERHRRGAVRCHRRLRGTRRTAAVGAKAMIQSSRQE